ncbi:MAG TPA: hypothetical protein VF491_22000, partial [Vicinamibacterales bacterium]
MIGRAVAAEQEFVPMRVLLIEDDEEIAGYIEQGLVEMRYSVERAANGRDGLRLGLTEEFDTIVLDR